MTNDAKLAALFRNDAPIADDGFTKRVLALAALEDRIAARRRAGVQRLAIETVGLAAVLAAFAVLSRFGVEGDVVPLTSPAMVGLILLGSWLAVGMRSSPRGA